MLSKRNIGLFLATFAVCAVCFAMIGAIILFPAPQKAADAAEDVFSPAPPPSDVLMLRIRDESKDYGCLAIHFNFESETIKVAFVDSYEGGCDIVSCETLSDVVDICGGTIYTEDNQHATALGRDVLNLLESKDHKTLANIFALILKRVLLPENADMLHNALLCILEGEEKGFSVVDYKNHQSFLETIAEKGNISAIFAQDFLKLIEKE